MKLAGGDFTAVQDQDGTWTIKNVPIFAEMPKGERGNPVAIDKAWLDNAVLKAQARRKANYHAPLHIFHHGENRPTTGAGFYIATHVAPVSYDGRQIYAIFADLYQVPTEVVDLIKAYKLPYRSVEISAWEKPEIQNLALLSDEAPFFKFPITTIGVEVRNAERMVEAAAPAMAFRSMPAGGGQVLFRFGGMAMPDDKAPVKVEIEKPGEEKKVAPPVASPVKAAEETPVTLETLAAHYKCMADVVKRIAAHTKFEMKDGELEIQPLPTGGEKPAAPAPEKESGKLDDKPSAPAPQAIDQKKPEEKPEGAKMSDATIVKLADLCGQVAALQKREDGRIQKEQVESLVAAAKAKLAGWHLSPDTEKRLVEFAEMGPKALDTFTESFRRTVPRDPPRNLASYDATVGAGDEYPAEVMKFADQGPDTLEKAKKFADLHAALKGRTKVALGRFIEIQLAAEPKLVAMKS